MKIVILCLVTTLPLLFQHSPSENFVVSTTNILEPVKKGESKLVGNLLVKHIINFAKHDKVNAFCATVDELSIKEKKRLFFGCLKLENDFYFLYLMRKYKIDVNSKNELGENAGFYLLDLSPEHLLERLRFLKFLGLEILALSDNGESVAHSCVRNDMLHVLEVIAFIEQGTLNSASADGNTPLMLAASLGKVKAVRDLIQKGADRELKNHDGKTAFDLVGHLAGDGFNGPLVSDTDENAIRELLK